MLIKKNRFYLAMTQWELKFLKSLGKWDDSKFFFTLQIENSAKILGSQTEKRSLKLQIQTIFEPIVA